ncbi:MAG: HD domain-containing protein [Candidatus Woesebacteria bacterium]|nr:MAG: HD domain-containing protein [Candidatus Woesebacteria bacterium]
MEILHNSSSPELVLPPRLEDLIAKEPLLQKAWAVAEENHAGQFRKDGVTPYFTHCVGVTRIMYEEWGITDPEKLAVGLLHDTVEDTNLTIEDIHIAFGEEVAFGVESVTQFSPEKEAKQIKTVADLENVRKVFAKTLVKPIVAIYKLADRLYNMRDMATMPQEKRVAKAIETLNDYAPLAESLGMWVVKRELENLSLQFTDPKNFDIYSDLMEKDPRTNEHFIAYMTSFLTEKLTNEGIGCEVSYRKNSLARIMDKAKNNLFKDIDDVISFRVMVNAKDERSVRDECMKVLGIIWEEFGGTEDQKRFDNFYFVPRDNGYSAFQVTLNLPQGAVKIAVASKEKEDYNNWGVLSLLKKGETDLKKYALKLVFTPAGEVKFFPSAANGYDFAYHIDEKLGAQAVEMLVNGEKRDLATIIPNGSVVKILGGEERIAPDADTIYHVLPKTKQKISKQFLELEMAQQQKKGREIVTKIISKRGLLNLYDVLRLKEYSRKIMDILDQLGSKSSLARLYQSIGSGVVSEEDLVAELDRNGITKEEMGFTSIFVEGPDGPGRLNFFTSEVEKLGGNIRRNYGESANQIFTQHLVIENLNGEAEKRLEELLKKDPRVSKVVVV